MPAMQPKRVRVVLADVAGTRAPGKPTRVELAEQTGIGEALVRGLVRAQLSLALRCAAVVAVGLGALPLLFAVAPAVAGARPFGIVLKHGVDVLWYPVGFAAGYLALLLFVAAPLRRSGAFTLPDFCELRLRSVGLRKLATGFVIVIGWLYLVPQLRGAGLTLQTVAGRPYLVGVLLVGLVVTANVALGGMRAVTFVQAFQYWLKLTALLVPMLFLLLHWQADGRPALAPPTGSTFAHRTTVTFDQPTRLILADGSTVDVPAHTTRTY